MSGDLNELTFDQAGLAFRRGTLKALNKDNVMFKQIDLHAYVEKLRTEANDEIFDFFEGIDPNTAARNLKLLYFYFVGSRNLLSDMTSESVSTYIHDQMQPMRKDLRRAMANVGKNRPVASKRY